MWAEYWATDGDPMSWADIALPARLQKWLRRP